MLVSRSAQSAPEKFHAAVTQHTQAKGGQKIYPQYPDLLIIIDSEAGLNAPYKHWIEWIVFDIHQIDQEVPYQQTTKNFTTACDLSTAVLRTSRSHFCLEKKQRNG